MKRSIEYLCAFWAGVRGDKPEVSNWAYNVVTVGDTIIDVASGTVG